MRYFLELAYDGTKYAGWQHQPNIDGIQDILEDRISTILREKISVTGCGRTDTGVHARQYFAHLDSDASLDDAFMFRLNNFLPKDIALNRILPVSPEAHARFDATERSYTYYIHFQKNPFLDSYSFYYQRAKNYPSDQLNIFAQKLLSYTDFQSFSKFHTDVHHYKCQLLRCEWVETREGLQLHISSDRFLRGMVRLIAGACLRFAEGKISLEELEEAMKSGAQIKASWAVPAHGLFLTKVQYPYIQENT